MSLNNIIVSEFHCPSCHRLLDELEIGEGAKVRAEIAIGEELPWSDSPSPVGEWETEGINQCIYCGTWISGRIRFLGRRVTRVEGISVDHDATPTDIAKRDE